ncbi:hypothetical protein MAPG_00717 [Magnaporthiopsis poae ATCC 64411]|uniref:Uncharacterized protein n=1 Tax=Magnaporthiopsis poae (strain ATCC 64411 / 73-15) TaxID=644358 RepID=A0A0C4DLS2_MAGP6|nr:hypothetical protein MAPG_00717 [Magnaporthiopsis poae ATCC 64411]
MSAHASIKGCPLRCAAAHFRGGVLTLTGIAENNWSWSDPLTGGAEAGAWVHVQKCVGERALCQPLVPDQRQD